MKVKVGTSEYRKIHKWVELMLGKPKNCVDCGTTTASRYHWANISGEYKHNVKDYKRLCAYCHYKLDFPLRYKTHCPQGHEYTRENTRLNKNGCRNCKECNRIATRNWRIKNARTA